MAAQSEVKELQDALGRDLAARLDVESKIPQRFVALLRELQHSETARAANADRGAEHLP